MFGPDCLWATKEPRNTRSQGARCWTFSCNPWSPPGAKVIALADVLLISKCPTATSHAESEVSLSLGRRESSCTAHDGCRTLTLAGLGSAGVPRACSARTPGVWALSNPQQPTGCSVARFRSEPNSTRGPRGRAQPHTTTPPFRCQSPVGDSHSSSGLIICCHNSRHPGNQLAS